MTELATAAPHSELAIGAEQDWFTDRQLAALKQHMGVADAPNADLAVFLHQCKRTGLDPFSKQIYMLARRTKDGNQWVTKWDIQVAIDGFRVHGDRIAARRGDDIEHDDPLWAGDDGIWRDVWTSETPPTAAKYALVKNGKRNVATAHYREYVQRKSDGNPNAMWTKMPCNQLAKCAEMQAWKKVYPNDFAGLNLEGASLPTDADIRAASGHRYVTTAERARNESKVIEEAPPALAELDPPITGRQKQKLAIIRDERYAKTEKGRADWFAWVAQQIGRVVSSNTQLTEAEATVLLDLLNDDPQTPGGGAQPHTDPLKGENNND